eukprot:tig00000494_g1573.t1
MPAIEKKPIGMHMDGAAQVTCAAARLRRSAAAANTRSRLAAEGPPPPRERAVRIFVSSTFAASSAARDPEDMAGERDAIRAVAHPRLHALCAERGLFLHVGDLRCARTRGTSAHKERKGNEDFRLNLEVAAPEFPWVHEFSNRSVTEIEMRAGVLRNPQAARGRTLFYFAEGAAPDAREGRYAAEQLEKLKEEIRGTGLPVAGYMTTELERLAVDMSRALGEMIERDFPLGRQETWLQQERVAQASFADPLRRTFVGDPREAAALDAYAAGAANPSKKLVLVCPEKSSGLGTSSLLADWSARWAAQHPKDFTIAHFVGGSRGSFQFSSIARRIREEVVERWPGQADLDLGGRETEVVARLKRWLEAGSHEWPGTLVLVLDALERLQGDVGVRSLQWLPRRLGPALRIVASCADGPSWQAFRIADSEAGEQFHSQITVANFDVDRRQEIVHRVLREQGRKLDPDRVRRIADAYACGNPLFLRTLLDELSAVAVHATLDGAIASCLGCGDAESLFRLVFARLARQYVYGRGEEGEERNPVALVAGAVVCSRHGMTEGELKALLRVGEGGSNSMTEIQWSLLWHGILPTLVSRDGVYGFGHRCAAQAAAFQFGLSAQEYAFGNPVGDPKDTEARQRLHGRLGIFFAAREPSQRRAEEGPWALARAGRADLHGEAIAALLCEADVLGGLELAELADLWRLSGRSREAAARFEARLAAYAASRGQDPFFRGEAEYLYRAGRVLEEMSRPAEGIPFLQRALAMDEADPEVGPGHPQTAEALHELARLYQADGQYSAALPPLQRALEISEAACGAAHAGTSRVVHSLARLYHEIGEYETALPLYERHLETEKAACDPSLATADAKHDLGKLFRDMGDVLTGSELVEEAWRDAVELCGPDHPEVATLSQSFAPSKAVLINRNAFGAEHPRTAAAERVLGAFYHATGDYARALPLLEHLIARPRALSRPRRRKALPLLEKSLARLQEACGPGHPEACEALHALARLRRDMGDGAQALDLCQRDLAIREEARGPEHPDTAAALDALGCLHAERGDFAAALPLLERSLRIRRAKFAAQNPLAKQAQKTLALVERLARTSSDLGCAEATRLLEEALAAQEPALGAAHLDVAEAMCALGDAAAARGQRQEALAYFKRALVVRREQLGEEHPKTLRAAAARAALRPEFDPEVDAVAKSPDEQYSSMFMNFGVAGATKPKIKAPACILPPGPRRIRT